MINILPRVWDGERYWYPCFSELGITYQNDELPFTAENTKTLDWAFDWNFGINDLEFSKVLERPAGTRDEKGALVYEGDIIEYEDQYWEVVYSAPTMEWGIMGSDYSIYGRKIERADVYVLKCRIVGNIHENGDLLK